MRRLATLARGLAAVALLCCACSDGAPETSSSAANDERMPIAVQYVRGATLTIHAKPSDNAPVVSTYQRGESVSILARKGEWAEVRTAGGSGWARLADMADSVEAQKAVADNLTPHFTRTPAPVSQPGAHGELVLEANVDPDGNVTSVRTISNTTGSTALEQGNIASLRASAFTPVVRHGRREAFVYEHRVHY